MTPEPPPMLETIGVRFGYPARPSFLGPIDLSVDKGDCWAIVGPNGAGKSTLLRLIAGLCRPAIGRAIFEGNDLAQMTPRARAQAIAFVPQHPPTDFDLSVRDIVLMGRFPHRSMGLFESASDYRIADLALEVTETAAFADRPIATLSGGEAQRVHVAAALTQQPRLLLLDEPTASLDLQHQLAIFEILRRRACDTGLSVVVVTHDVNLASHFCSHVLLLHAGKPVAVGPPGEVLTPDILGRVYGVELELLASKGDSDNRWVVPVTISKEGRG